MKPTPIFHASVLALMMLSACSMAPDYVRPDFKFEDQFHSDLPLSQSDQELKNITWWDQFNDPLLSTLIHEACTQNFDMQIARKKIEYVIAGRDEAVSYLFPTVDMNASIIKEKRPQATVLTGSPAYTTASNAGFQASWELDLFGRAQSALQAQEALLEQTHFTYLGVKLALMASVAEQYMLYHNARAQITITENMIKKWETYIALREKLVNAGLSNAQECLTLRSFLLKEQSLRSNLKALQKNAANAMASLLGKSPGGLDDRLNQAPDHLPVISNQQILSQLPSDIIFNRPDIAAAEQDLRQQTALIGVARSELLPKFSLTGSYAWQGPATNQTFSTKNVGWSVGPFIHLPLFDFGRIQAQIKQQETLKDISALTFQKHILEALQDIEKCLNQLNSHLEQSHFAHTDMMNHKNAFQIARTQHQAGIKDYSHMLEDEIAYLSALRVEVDAKTKLNLSFIYAYKALGGGYGVSA
ncbi:MAG: efflux transporter outer membrane subunit [Alphaproteobacteria bacterium]|nr:efflux transporter outer membrane subunit [Alphaproteobacteria bacterium]